MVLFEDLTVKTITLVVVFDAKVILDHVYDTFNINLVPDARVAAPGTVWQGNYGGKTRGLVEGKSFRNSIILSVVMDKYGKTVSVKLLPDKIQMCGLSSLEQGLKATKIVLNHLVEAETYLRYLAENPDQLGPVLNWYDNYLNNFRVEVSEPRAVTPDFIEGSPDTVTSEITSPGPQLRDLILSGDLESEEESDENVSFLKPASTVSKAEVAHLDPFVFHLLSRCIDGHRGPEEILIHMRALLGLSIFVKRPSSLPIQVTEIREEMAGYSYNIGFFLDRFKLHKLANHYQGFYSTYNNAIDNEVFIILPLKEVSDEDRRSGKKIPRVNFRVRYNGSVNQSGRGGQHAKKGFERFMGLLAELRPEIEVEAD